MDARTPLLVLPSGLVEDLSSSGACGRERAESFSPEFQIAFPYRGVFIWHVAREAVVGDANQILFVTGGEPFRMSEPLPGGYAEMIVTPPLAVLSALTEAAGFDPCRHPLFRARSRRATPAVQRACAALLHRGPARADDDTLEDEEVLLALLRAALAIEPAPRPPSAPTRRLIRRTKEFLDSAFARPLRLSDVADAVGSSSAYLTDVFRRFEGVSLQRYVTQLRLARALVELPHADDLTVLALDLGFSSHSHFTLAFRRAFGCTPSQFRSAGRRRSAVRADRKNVIPDSQKRVIAASPAG